MPDSARHLPPRPSLEQLRKQAKELLRDYRTGDAAAAGRFHAVNSRFAEPGRSDEVSLADAQFILAREYGFEHWPKLVRHVESISPSDRLHPYERLVEDIVLVGRRDEA
jgi:hypothetical protein